jgi:hypothetical protein
VSLYVDDGACCTNDKELYQEFLNVLKDKYKLSDSSDLDWHLGIKFTQYHENCTISLDQTAYYVTLRGSTSALQHGGQ